MRHFYRLALVSFSLLVAVHPRAAFGQSILDEQLEVAKELQPLDHLIRDQLVKWFDEREAALTKHGRQSEEWFEVND